MSAILLSGPTEEPVTSAALRQHLRLEDGDGDLLASLISAARMTIEAQSGLRLMLQKWRILIDQWPQEILPLAIRPVREISAVGLVGARSILPQSSYELQQIGDRSVLRIITNELPEPKQSRFGIRIDLMAGFGTTPDAVPQDLRLAVMSLAAHWYDLEDWTQSHVRHAMPANIAMLVDNHRGPQL